ncbi:MAG: NAD(P)H-hydrate dehydratase [Promethearchaeota archaeon]
MRDFNREISVKEMNAVDQNTTDYGVPIDFLMECAGYSAADKIYSKYNLNPKDEQKNKVVLFCGTGNNGGDGFVVARHLLARQIKCNVILVGDPLRIRTEHAKRNWNILNNLVLNINILIIRDSSGLNESNKVLVNLLNGACLIVDCLLGTGVRGSVREPIRSAIQLINLIKQNKMVTLKFDTNPKIISIDVPSGMNPDNGEIPDICVEPDLLITFHREKMGFAQAKLKIPEVIVKSIGIPQDADLFVGTGDLKVNLKRRDPNNHKGQHGKVLVIGGSEQYSGAPTLAALAALEMDVDLVIAYVPNSVANVVRTFSPNLIVREGKGKNICEEDVDELEPLIDWADSIVIGPGIGLAPETKSAFKGLLKLFAEKQKPVVIDADGIKIVAEYKDLLKKTKAVITPHEGEFYILTGTKLPPQNSFEERARILELVAMNYGVTFLVKGRYDYISNSSQTRINKTGVPEMAVGGTGDILSGILGALLSFGLNEFNATCVAAYISGKLGEEYKLLHRDINNQKLMRKNFKSSDLLNIIPYIISKYI